MKNVLSRLRLSRRYRPREGALLLIVTSVGLLGLGMAEITYLLVDLGENPFPAFLPALQPAIVLALFLSFCHLFLCWRRIEAEQVILPTVGLLLAIGFIMILRILTLDQLWRHLLLGLGLGGGSIVVFIIWPRRMIKLIRQWAFPISAVGLFLLLMTLLFGVKDESNAKLAIQIFGISFQTSEPMKVALIIFLARYIEQMGETIEGFTTLWFGRRIPDLRYFIPILLFICVAMAFLYGMKDLGAVLILGFLFVFMLYVGFDTRVFLPVAMFGLTGFVSLVLFLAAIGVSIPPRVQGRLIGWWNPWSNKLVWHLGTEVPVHEGPGYQLLQAIYATVAGGITGTGIGFGCVEKDCIVFAHSDLILAAVVEELGLIVMIPLLALFVILTWRILRLATMLSSSQVFERLLLVGIALHLFIQVFIIAGGTFSLIPLTGVTVPFLSHGGMALMVNLIGIGMVLAMTQQIER